MLKEDKLPKWVLRDAINTCNRIGLTELPNAGLRKLVSLSTETLPSEILAEEDVSRILSAVSTFPGPTHRSDRALAVSGWSGKFVRIKSDTYLYISHPGKYGTSLEVKLSDHGKEVVVDVLKDTVSWFWIPFCQSYSIPSFSKTWRHLKSEQSNLQKLVSGIQAEFKVRLRATFPDLWECLLSEINKVHNLWAVPVPMILPKLANLEVRRIEEFLSLIKNIRGGLLEDYRKIEAVSGLIETEEVAKCFPGQTNLWVPREDLKNQFETKTHYQNKGDILRNLQHKIVDLNKSFEREMERISGTPPTIEALLHYDQPYFPLVDNKRRNELRLYSGSLPPYLFTSLLLTNETAQFNRLTVPTTES